ncbi:MAG: hypothetical protein P4M07_28105 [Xanthobacteraceae bacterium]|nr:hypothetical protein [Xanthobacteraceae bacterium]
MSDPAMFLIEPAFQQVQVVLIGKFNPAIIQPGWLAKHGIVGETEALNARVGLIHPDISTINLAHVDVVVEPDKCTIQGKGIHFDVVRDFVLKTFGEFLFHTPISAMGINFVVHFDCGSFKAREEFALRLAPREPWGEWSKDLEGPAEGVGHGGLTSISMTQNMRPDGRKGSVQVRLEPSSRIPNSGVFMLVNDHYALDEGTDSAQAMEVVDLGWETSLKYSNFIINCIMKNFAEKNA